MGSDLLKLTVVMLCSINSVMWEFYTESTFMALVWAAIAIVFAVWTSRDRKSR